MIGIRLLPSVGRLKAVSYNMNILQSLINQSGTNKWRLTHFKSSNRIPKLPTIQNIIRSNKYGLIETVIISKLLQRQMLIQISLEINYTSSMNIFEGMNSMLCLTIRLGMKAVLSLTLEPNPSWNVSRQESRLQTRPASLTSQRSQTSLFTSLFLRLG